MNNMMEYKGYYSNPRYSSEDRENIIKEVIWVYDTGKIIYKS